MIDKTLPPEEQAIQAQADRILDQLDAHVMALLTLHDIGKCMPHPYDAVGQYACGIAHDFANTAYGFRKYIEQTRPQGAEYAKRIHQHEAWQLQESAKGGLYCAACGEDVPGVTIA